MPKKPPKLRLDAVEVAYRVMLEATGQAEKTDHVWTVRDIVALMDPAVARVG